MTVVDAQAWSRLAERLELVQERLVTNVQNHARIRNKLSDGIDTEVARQRALQESAIVRLGARLESQPVIEQAKGILMGRSGCSDDEAFDILRRASQRSNLRVRESPPSSWLTPHSSRPL